MCVVQENDSSRRLPSCDELLYELFPLATGVIVRLDRGANVLLTECGDGELLRHLSGMFPRSRFAGIDGATRNVARARQLARESGRRNLSFESAGHRFRCHFHLILSLAGSEPAIVHDFGALHERLCDSGTVFLRDDTGAATDGLRQAGFAAFRHVVLPNPSLSHVYIARK